jgi:hypothetical protein
MRRAEGAFTTKADKNGQEYYLHRLNGATPTKTPAPPLPPRISGGERADADTLNTVYSALLTALRLSDAHRDRLRGRGLTDDEIDRRGYRTLAVQGRHRLAARLRERFGDMVLAVPGFVVKQGQRGPFVSIAGAAGLVVPVRDTSGRIVALLVRRDDNKDGRGKYQYVSSSRVGGPRPGAPVHVPCGVASPAEVVRVTEGALKADIAFALSGVPTIGMAGLAWRPVLAVLRELGAKTVRLALDMDARDKRTVALPLDALAQALIADGFAVELERWPAEHKGVDDALVAGNGVEVMGGEAARQAIADILTEATAGEATPEPGPLGRLPHVLANGVEALFRDGELLRSLAGLAEENPAEFACCRNQLQHAGVKLRDLDKVLAPLRQDIRREKGPCDAVESYRIVNGRIVHDVQTRDGPAEKPLCNFAGRIAEEIVYDDGVEHRLSFVIEGSLPDGTPLPRAEVAGDRFAWMRWPVEVWGTRAVVFAGAGTADHLRVALQLLSGAVARQTVYKHTGWRELAGRWVYLHAGGAIGAHGPVEDIEVRLPSALSRFVLPTPPQGAELINAVRASLRILALGPARIVFPLLAADYRAVLAECDFGLHLVGRTGAFKTEIAALDQQHFGVGMDARNLPGNWASTGNSLEALAFAAMHALLCVDDFSPTGSTADVQRYHREADRLFRAQGNNAGRGRCRTDGTPNAPKPPRGLVLSTGEDVPRGHSLRARLLVIEVSRGDINSAKLTEAQRDAAAGLYAACMAGFLRWLAQRYGEVRAALRRERAELRDRARSDGQHARTPGIVADLALGMKCFLAFALEAGAITAEERDDLDRRCWAALGEAAAAHGGDVDAADASDQFLRLLRGVLASGRGYLASPGGAEPEHAELWGWRQTGDNWWPLGHRVGWLEGTDVFLEPESCFAEVQELARQQGDSLPVQPRTLWRRLHEQGILASKDDSRQRFTVRRRLGGHERHEVLHLRVDTLSPPTGPSPPSPNGEKPREKAVAAGDGRGDGCAGDGTDRPHDRPQNGPEKVERNGAGDGGDGREQEREAPAPEKTAVAGERRRWTI